VYKVLSSYLFSVFLVAFRIWNAKISSDWNSQNFKQNYPLFDINRATEDREAYNSEKARLGYHGAVYK
jgi:hypothetical protein